MLEEFRDRRRYAFERLTRMGLAPTWPVGGFFFWVPVGGFGMDGRAFAEPAARRATGPGRPGVRATGRPGADSCGSVSPRTRAGCGKVWADSRRSWRGLRGEPVVQSARVPTAEPGVERPPVFSRV